MNVVENLTKIKADSDELLSHKEIIGMAIEQSGPMRSLLDLLSAGADNAELEWFFDVPASRIMALALTSGSQAENRMTAKERDLFVEWASGVLIDLD